MLYMLVKFNIVVFYRYSYNRQKDKLHTEGHNPRSIPSFQTNVNHKENNQTIIPSTCSSLIHNYCFIKNELLYKY